MAKILNRYTGKVICEDANLELKELVVKYKANLYCADLRGANF